MWSSTFVRFVLLPLALAVSGDTVIAGAFGHQHSGIAAGTAFVSGSVTTAAPSPSPTSTPAPTTGSSMSPSVSPTLDWGAVGAVGCLATCAAEEEGSDAINSVSGLQEYVSEIMQDCSFTGAKVLGIAYCVLDTCVLDVCSAEELSFAYYWANDEFERANDNSTAVDHGIIRFTNSFPEDVNFTMSTVLAPGGAEPLFLEATGTIVAPESFLDFTVPLFERLEVKFHLALNSSMTNDVYVELDLDAAHDVSSSVVSYFSDEQYGHSYKSSVTTIGQFDAEDVNADGALVLLDIDLHDHSS